MQKKNIIQYILIVIFLSGFIWYVMQMLISYRALLKPLGVKEVQDLSMSRMGTGKTQVDVFFSETTEEDKTFVRFEEQTRNKKILRDPFQKKQKPEPLPPPPEEVLPQLYGIAIHEGEPVAIIDNQITRVGGFIDGYKITEITKEKVFLNNGKKEVVLQLKF